MKHKSLSIISIIGAVIAGLVSIGNLVYLMVIKAQELKAQGADLLSQITCGPQIQRALFFETIFWAFHIVLLSDAYSTVFQYLCSRGF